MKVSENWVWAGKCPVSEFNPLGIFIPGHRGEVSDRCPSSALNLLSSMLIVHDLRGKKAEKAQHTIRHQRMSVLFKAWVRFIISTLLIYQPGLNVIGTGRPARK